MATKFRIFAACMLAAGVATVHADVVDLGTCDKIKNVSKRGACFEALARQAAQPMAEDEIASFVRKAKARVAEEFFDPDSARFRSLFVTRNQEGKSPHRTLCGEVNAKNRYGGYVGYKMFYLTRYLDGEPRWDTTKFLGSGDSPAENRLIELVWRHTCVEDPTAWKE